MPSFRATLIVLVVGGGAVVAEAQTAPQITMKLLRKVDDTHYSTFNTEQQTEFFNEVNCVCGRLFGVEILLTNRTASLPDADLQIWTGTNCSSDDPDEQAKCKHIQELDRPLGDYRELIRLDVSAGDLMFPTSACASVSGSNTVWGLVDTNADRKWEHKFSITPVIQFDAKRPPAVEEATTAGVEDAVKLSWELPTTTTDIRSFQVYCASSLDGSPLYVKPPGGEAEFDRTDDVPGCTAQLPTTPDAGAGAPDAGIDAGGGKPQEDMFEKFAALDPEYRCSGRIGGTATGYRIELPEGPNVKEFEPGEMVKVKLVVVDNARNGLVMDLPDSPPPTPVRDGWEWYHDQGGAADGGFCFVATAVYGDYDHPYVRVLRELRDGTLARFGAGRAFIDWYYRVSPPMADWLRRHDVARALAAAALFPVVAVAWAWNLLGGAGVAALVLLVWATRRRLRRKRLLVAAAVGVAALCAAARPASAQAIIDESVFDAPKGPPLSRWAFEIKLGPYYPDVDGEEGLTGTPYKDVFGDASLLFIGLELQHFFFHPAGQLGLAASVAHVTDSGRSFKQDPDTGAVLPEKSEDTTTFRMFPLALSVVYRFTGLADRTLVPIVPYAKLGLSYYVWQITKGNGDVSNIEPAGKGRGGTLGWQGTVGLAVRADRFDPDASRALTTELGVEHAGFFFELTYADVSGLFQDNRLHVGDLTWTAGVNFEF